MRATLILLILGLALTAPCFAQGTGGDLTLETAVNGGPYDQLDKGLANSDLLAMKLASPGGTLVGMPAIIAGSLVPDGWLVCIDLDGNPATCEFNLPDPDFFFIVAPSGTSALYGAVTPGGYTLTVPMPADPTFWASVDDEALRLQGGTINPAAPLGVEITNFIDHPMNQLTIPGPTSDDGNVMIYLESGFPFYGTVWTEVYVNSNGNLTFGSSDFTYDPTESDMLGNQPRIALGWSDLSPNDGGSVTAQIDRTPGGNFVSLAVDWVGVPSYFAPGTLNTMSAVLQSNGDFDISWTEADFSSTDTVVGISPGGGLSLANDVGPFGALLAPVAGTSLQAIYHLYDGTCGNSARELPGGTATYTYDGIDAYTLTPGGTYTVLPTEVFGLSPNNGSEAGGDTVDLTGCGFDPLNTYDVDFVGAGSVPATVLDVTTLQCVTPPGIGLGTVDVAIYENALPIGLLPSAFTFVPSGGFNGPATDDGNAWVVANGSVTFYGVVHTDIYVNSNGNITFGSSSSAYSETEFEMLNGLPRIAPHWDDLNPSSGGTIAGVDNPATFTVSYVNVPAYNTGANGSTVTIDKATGEITISYAASCTSWNGLISSRSVISGITPGGSVMSGTPATLVPVDLSTNSGAIAGPTEALYEYFNDSSFIMGLVPWDLDGATFGFTPTGGGYLHHNP